MPLTKAFAVQHNTTVLAGLTQLDTQFGAEVRSDVGVGSLFPQFAVVAGVRPRLQFSSRAIDAVLGLTGTTGVAITSAATLKAIYAQIDAATGQPASGNVHNIYTFDRGLLVPRRLQASHRQDATLDVEAITYSSDGVVKPLIETTGALPTIARDNIRHTLKSSSLGAIDLGCLTDISVDFGVNADTLGCKSDTYDKHLTIDNGITPVITITTLDTNVAIALEGLIGTHANSTIVLRQYAADGILFAASTEDITLTAYGVITRDSHSGSGNQRSALTVRMTCSWDGTNAPIVIS